MLYRRRASECRGSATGLPVLASWLFRRWVPVHVSVGVATDYTPSHKVRRSVTDYYVIA